MTGGDAEAAAIQRILAGEQYSTIYLAIKQAGRDLGELAVAAAQGKMDAGRPREGRRSTTGPSRCTSVLLAPIAVTKDNIAGHGHQGRLPDKPTEICTGKYAAACKEAGLQ